MSKRTADGSDAWIVDGQRISLPGVAIAGAAYGGPRARSRSAGTMCRRWSFSARERLKAMDADGVDYSVLYPSVGGLAGRLSASSTTPIWSWLACRLTTIG